jgi:hypothetical protein
MTTKTTEDEPYREVLVRGHWRHVLNTRLDKYVRVWVPPYVKTISKKEK